MGVSNFQNRNIRHPFIGWCWTKAWNFQLLISLIIWSTLARNLIVRLLLNTCSLYYFPEILISCCTLLAMLAVKQALENFPFHVAKLETSLFPCWICREHWIFFLIQRYLVLFPSTRLFKLQCTYYLWSIWFQRFDLLTFKGWWSVRIWNSSHPRLWTWSVTCFQSKMLRHWNW